MYRQVKNPVLLECINNKSNKFYEISAFKDSLLDANKKQHIYIKAMYGSIGAKKPRHIIKGSYPSLAQVEKSINSLIKEKTKKGYSLKEESGQQMILI